MKVPLEVFLSPLAFDFSAGQGRKRFNRMCSGNARIWEQLYLPRESNSDHQVPPITKTKDKDKDYKYKRRLLETNSGPS